MFDWTWAFARVIMCLLLKFSTMFTLNAFSFYVTFTDMESCDFKLLSENILERLPENVGIFVSQPCLLRATATLVVFSPSPAFPS